MNVSPPLLDILCCPVSHEPLLPLGGQRLSRLNQEIAAGKVEDVAHQTLTSPLKTALITRDGKLIYPVESGIPVLLAERAIATLQFEPPL
ncbi:MAG: Trm112 family protein [Wenzhouxiangella sp.]